MPYFLVLTTSFLVGYLMGSVPFGLLMSRLAGHGDIRRIGSGNIGTTNVLRTGDKTTAALVLALDMFKGAAPVLAVASLWGEQASLVTAAAAVLGHNFPVWLRFRGGKGMATTLGVLLAAAWQVGLVMLGLWIAMAALFRVSSLAALVALIAAPVTAWILDKPEVALVSLGLAALGWARHAANIKRLLQGVEPRIGGQKDK